MQIAPPSRGDLENYRRIRSELENLAGKINGRYSDYDWIPIRYLNRSFSRGELSCLYRNAGVGLVTPLWDGMNLVAKEYIAAQNPEDPGVLVLSRFAGAAEDLTEALIVNPYDHDEVSNALYRALTMSLRERRERWRTLMSKLQGHDVHHWHQQFFESLEKSA